MLAHEPLAPPRLLVGYVTLAGALRTMHRTPSQTMFAYIADRPDEDIDLGVAALLIGEWEHDNLDVARYIGIMDELAVRAGRRMDAGDPLEAIRAINQILFDEQGFRGNQADYYDPRNSFLSAVIDRRTGIPISLSVLYIEVARRMDVAIRGVGFPGHFLVRHDTADGPLIIDPFRLGIRLHREALEEVLHTVAGDKAELTPALLEPVSKHQILLRILNNLALIYRRRGDSRRSLEVLERINILQPKDSRLARELEQLRRRPHDIN